MRGADFRGYTAVTRLLLPAIRCEIKLGRARFLVKLSRRRFNRCRALAGSQRSEVRDQRSALLPLDGTRWFGRDIVNDAIDAFDFVNDAVGDAGE
jgi:hypothetical protein